MANSRPRFAESRGAGHAGPDAFASRQPAASADEPPHAMALPTGVAGSFADRLVDLRLTDGRTAGGDAILGP